MTEQTCDCGRPTSGATLCDRCVKTLEIAVVNVAAHYIDLDTLRTKRARYGSSSGGKSTRGKEQPLPLDGRFTDVTGAGSEVDHDARATIVAWCRDILEDQPELVGPTCRTCLHVSCAQIRRRKHPVDTVPSMCAYLLRQMRIIASAQWATTLLDEVLDIERRLSRIVDRPADKWYAGICAASDEDEEASCNAELYAQRDRGTIMCKACGTVHDVKKRREFLLAEAREYLVTATEAAGALLSWTDYDGSEHKLIDRIRKWEERKRLTARGEVEVLGQARNLYRLGDIQALLIDHAQHAQDRRIKGVA